MFKTFCIETEIRKVTQQYINPLVRCDVCQHRVCRCHDEINQTARRTAVDDDVASDNRSRAEDMNHGR